MCRTTYRPRLRPQKWTIRNLLRRNLENWREIIRRKKNKDKRRPRRPSRRGRNESRLRKSKR